MTETIFSKIIRREVPADIVYEDDHCLAFRDINPQAPSHILIIPKDTLQSIQEAKEEHTLLLGHLVMVAKKVAEKEKLAAMTLALIGYCDGQHDLLAIAEKHQHYVLDYLDLVERMKNEDVIAVVDT